MSMIGTILAFVVFPLKAKPASPTTEVALEHRRNAYAHLWREHERLRAELGAAGRDRDAARATCICMIDENEELRRQLESQEQTQRERQLAQYHAQAQSLMAMRNQLAQESLQGLQQNALNSLPAQWAQAMQSPYSDFFCNCVPSREQAFGVMIGD